MSDSLLAAVRRGSVSFHDATLDDVVYSAAESRLQLYISYVEPHHLDRWSSEYGGSVVVLTYSQVSQIAELTNVVKHLDNGLSVYDFLVHGAHVQLVLIDKFGQTWAGTLSFHGNLEAVTWK